MAYDPQALGKSSPRSIEEAVAARKLFEARMAEIDRQNEIAAEKARIEGERKRAENEAARWKLGDIGALAGATLAIGTGGLSLAAMPGIVGAAKLGQGVGNFVEKPSVTGGLDTISSALPMIPGTAEYSAAQFAKSKPITDTVTALKDFTPESVAAYMATAQSGKPDISLLKTKGKEVGAVAGRRVLTPETIAQIQAQADRKKVPLSQLMSEYGAEQEYINGKSVWTKTTEKPVKSSSSNTPLAAGAIADITGKQAPELVKKNKKLLIDAFFAKSADPYERAEFTKEINKYIDSIPKPEKGLTQKNPNATAALADVMGGLSREETKAARTKLIAGFNAKISDSYERKNFIMGLDNYIQGLSNTAFQEDTGTIGQ